MPKNTIIAVMIAAALPLLLPLVLMRFTDEVQWDLTDFMIMWALLASAGLALSAALRHQGAIAYRIAAGIAILTAFLLIWITLAVGVIGSEDNPANLLYVGVLGIGILGSAVAWREPRAMARVLFMMTAAQALVPVAALVVWRPEIGLEGLGVFVLNGIFVVLFFVSGLLFRRAHSSEARVLA